MVNGQKVKVWQGRILGSGVVFIMLGMIFCLSAAEATMMWKPAEAAMQRLDEINDKCVSPMDINKEDVGVLNAEVQTGINHFYQGKPGVIKAKGIRRSAGSHRYAWFSIPSVLEFIWSLVFAILLARILFRFWSGRKK